jgi:transcription elongation GreA/GreB family factor
MGVSDRSRYQQSGYLTCPEDILGDVAYCLPFEIDMIQRTLGNIKDERFNVADDIRQAMTGSSETWHDNPTAEVLFSYMSQLDSKEIKLHKALRYLRKLPLPLVEMDFVTAGSKARIQVAGPAFDLLVVGNAPLRRPDTIDDADVSTIDAPISRAILGKQVGETGVFEVGGATREVTLLGIDQIAIQTISSYATE